MVDSHRLFRATLCLALVVLCAGGIALVYPGALAIGTSALTRPSGPFAVNFHNLGLTGGLTWRVNVSNSSGPIVLSFATVNQSYLEELAAGSYTYTASGPTGWSFARTGPVAFTVHGPRVVAVPFAVASGLQPSSSTNAAWFAGPTGR